MAPKHPVDYFVRDWLREALVGLLLFFLLWEWLRPLLHVSAVTDIYWLKPILIAIASFILIDYSRCPLGLNALLKLTVCLLIIVNYYYPGTWWEAYGWGRYYDIVLEDLGSLVSGDWTELSAENRTLMFLSGWALMIYALYSLMVFRQTSLWFVVTTLLYLVGFQLWTGTDTSMGLLRTAGFGLLMLAVLRIPQLERQFQATNGVRHWPLRWGMLSLVIVALLLGAGWLGASGHERETTALHWQDWSVEAMLRGNWGEDTVGSSELSRTGYDEDDSVLGGAIREDHTVAFTAITEKLTYWRGETKSVYTGRGWIEYDRPTVSFVPQAIEDEAVYEQEIELGSSTLGGMLFAGGPIADIDMLETAEGQAIPLEHVMVQSGSSKVELTFDRPADRYRLAIAASDTPVLSERDLEAYLQLPVDYDGRIRELAEEVTRDAPTAKAKAEAIAAYLSTEYLYRLDAMKTPAGEDFVAHFLFDTKEGYCDHFSSAMVVMLRSVGVPARWTKGFATGEVTQSSFGDTPHYEVTVRNSDAHSWAEVYLPDTGWTMFEPTPGFAEDAESQGVASVGREALGVAASEAKEQHSISLSHTAGPLVVVGKLLVEELKTFDIQAAIEQGRLWVRTPYGIGSLVLAVMLLLAVLLRRQLRISKRLSLQALDDKKMVPEDAYAKVLQRYWNKVYRRYGPKRPGQTLREYVAELQVEGGRKEALSEMLGWHERYAFGGERLRRMSAYQLEGLWKQIKGRK